MAQNLPGYFDLRHMSGLSGADMEKNSVSADGFAAGQPIWMHDALGPKIFRLVQNRGSATMIRGMLVSKVGDNNGITIVTNSVGTTTSISHLSAALTVNALVGGFMYLASTGSTAAATTEAEGGFVVKNSATVVDIDPDYPYTAAPGAGLIAHVRGTYNAELAVSADWSTTCLGAVVPKNGITTGNFGFVQSFGSSFRVLKTLATSNSVFTVGSAVVVSSGSGQCYQATTATGLQLVIGRALAPASSVAAECFLDLACGMGLQVVNTGQVS